MSTALGPAVPAQLITDMKSAPAKEVPAQDWHAILGDLIGDADNSVRLRD